MRPSFFLAATAIFVLGTVVLGVLGSSLVFYRIDSMQRDAALIEAGQASLLVSGQDIASLAGTPADISNPVYQRLKTQLQLFQKANPQIRSVYLLGNNAERHSMFYYIDSKSPSTPDYAPPGKLLNTDQKQDIQQRQTGEAYTEGPFTDAKGEWITGYVPLKNEQGMPIATIAVDISTAQWQAQLTFARTAIHVVMILLLIILIIVGADYYWKLRSQKKAAAADQVSGSKPLTSMQQAAPLGSFAIEFPEGTVIVDEQFLPIFKTARMNKELFRTFIHLDDQEKFEDMIKEITVSAITYSGIDVRIGTADAGFRKYHIYGNIERHSSGSAARFDGVMQDVTDGK